MRVVYTPGQAAEDDLALLNELPGCTVVTGTMREHLADVEDGGTCAIRGADLALTRGMVADFLDHAREAQDYAYADLTYAGRPEITIELFSDALARKLRGIDDAFLPGGNLDMKYADQPTVHAFADRRLADFVSTHLDAFQYPRGMCIEPASVCNLRCEMCTWQVTNVAKAVRGPRVMPFELFEKLAAEIEQWPVKPGVEFCWRGEPLMNTRLPEAIGLFSAIGCNTSLPTNTTLLDADTLERLKKAKLSSLQVSLDSLDKDEYENVRKGASFETVMRNLRRAADELRSGPTPAFVGVRMVRLEENKPHWDAVFEAFENDLNGVTLQNQVYFENGQYRARHMYGFRPRKFCILPFQAVVIAANGDVYSCGATKGEDEAEVLGNIRDESVMDIWHGEKMGELWRQMLNLSVEEPFQCFRCSRMVCAAGFVRQTRRGNLLDKTLEGVRYTNRLNLPPEPAPREEEASAPTPPGEPAHEEPAPRASRLARLKAWIWRGWVRLPRPVRLPIKLLVKPPLWAVHKTVKSTMSALGFNGADVRLTLRLFKSGVRDRYMGSMLGLAWAVLNPLLLLGMYTFVFAFVFRATIPGNPSKFAFAVWMISGFVPYLAVADALTATAGSVINAGGLVKNVVFKSEVLPLSATLGSAVPCAVGLVLLLGLMCLAGTFPTWHIVLLIPVMILQFTFMAGLGMFLAATTVFVRDVMEALTTLTLLIVFFTPIFYPLELMPAVLQKVTFLNPFHHMVDAYRSVLWHHRIPDWRGVAYLGGLGVVFFVVGLKYFRRLKGYFEMAI